MRFSFQLVALITLGVLEFPVSIPAMQSAVRVQGYSTRATVGKSAPEARFQFDAIFDYPKSRIEAIWQNGAHMVIGSDGTSSYVLNLAGSHSSAGTPATVTHATIAESPYPLLSYTGIQALWMALSLALDTNALTQCSSPALRSMGRPPHVNDVTTAISEWTSSDPPYPQRVVWKALYYPNSELPTNRSHSASSVHPYRAAELNFSHYTQLGTALIPTNISLTTFRPNGLLTSPTFEKRWSDDYKTITGQQPTPRGLSLSLRNYLKRFPDKLKDVEHLTDRVETHAIHATNIATCDPLSDYRPELPGPVNVNDYRFFEDTGQIQAYTLTENKWLELDDATLNQLIADRTQGRSIVVSPSNPGSIRLTILLLASLLMSSILYYLTRILKHKNTQ